MVSDKREQRPKDFFNVNYNEPEELIFWENHFGVSEKRIKDAVSNVGSSFIAVEQYLNSIKSYYCNVIGGMDCLS